MTLQSDWDDVGTDPGAGNRKAVAHTTASSSMINWILYSIAKVDLPNHESRITNIEDGTLFQSTPFSIHPDAHNTRNLGTTSDRWANVYAVNVYAGDLVFEESFCEICGESFVKDDVLVLKVKEISEGTHTIPVHLRCV